MRIIGKIKKIFRKKKKEEIYVFPDNIRIVGQLPKLEKTQPLVHGENNKITFKEETLIADSKIIFDGNNNSVQFGKKVEINKSELLINKANNSLKCGECFRINKSQLSFNGINNKVICGKNDSIDGTKIIINGDNNNLIIEDNINLNSSQIEFKGNNSVIYISSSKYETKLRIIVYTNTTFYIGRDNYINDLMEAIVSEEQNVFIGNDGLYSFGIMFRTADPHLIYDIKTNKRINISKSIYIGDHVWIGQDVLLLKGTQVDSGSIIGANAVISNKKIGHNEVWCGNPIKLIKKDIFWDNRCVHNWTQKDTELSLDYNNLKGDKAIDVYHFKYDSKQYLSFDKIDQELKQLTCNKKIDYLKEISANDNKNRFVRKSNGISKDE